MSRWDLINPSDSVTFETDDFALAALVTVLLGSGQYGARELEGDRVVPIMLLGSGTFFEDNFSKNGQELIEEVLNDRPEELARAFDSVSYAHERSSLNNIKKRAEQFAASLRGGTVAVSRAPQQVFVR